MWFYVDQRHHRFRLSIKTKITQTNTHSSQNNERKKRFVKISHDNWNFYSNGDSCPYNFLQLVEGYQNNLTLIIKKYNSVHVSW